MNTTSRFQDEIQNGLTLMKYEFVNDYLRKKLVSKILAIKRFLYLIFKMNCCITLTN